MTDTQVVQMPTKLFRKFATVVGLDLSDSEWQYCFNLIDKIHGVSGSIVIIDSQYPITSTIVYGGELIIALVFKLRIVQKLNINLEPFSR